MEWNVNALFAENKVYELYNLYNENKGISMKDLCVKKTSTPPVWIFSRIANLK